MIRYTLCACLLLPTVLSAAPELKGDPAELTQYLLDEKRVVSITANGEAKAQADRATIMLRVKTRDGAFVQALKANRDVRTKLSQLLQQAGITADRISAAKFSSVPNYGFFGDKPSNYEISNDVSIVVRGEDDMTVIAQAVDGMKEVSYLAARFEDSNRKMHESEALNDALAGIALQKAAYEKALGIVLTPLRVMETGYPPMQQVIPYEEDAAQSQGHAAMAIKSAAEFAVSENSNGTSAGGFGELRYTTSVIVEYLLQPR